jgi:hypothetical protein
MRDCSVLNRSDTYVIRMFREPIVINGFTAVKPGVYIWVTDGYRMVCSTY